MSDSEAGLLLPPDVVQPFGLRLLRDDLHVMAFFDGHPSYEAAEAMIRRRPEGGAVIRAILTRHDQSQVDHVNDEEQLEAARSARRETCLRSIALHEERTAAGPRARVTFESHSGEPVLLDVVAAGEPDARWGGLSDPGRHSGDSVLPLLWRGKSTLAGPASRVSIGGAPFRVTRGYYSERHSLGVLRAGVAELRLLATPEPIALGGEWRYERSGESIAYRVTDVASDGRLAIERRGGPAELVVARPEGGCLRVSEIAVGPGLELSFGAGARFGMRIEAADDAVTGTYESRGRGDTTVLRLSPLQPAWARARAVEVQCSRSRDMLALATAIAPARRGGE